MRKFVLLVLVALLTFSSKAQLDNKIVIGKIDSVYSNILHEPRKIWIYTPDMTSGDRDPGKRYPVLYLLDGDAHFPSVTGLVQQLSQSNGNTVLPEMIIVGIPNTDRTRDLTPTHVTSDPPMLDSVFSKSSGGGENFLAFIEKELMPHVETLYPAAPYKVLVGHSFGGLTVMNALANHANLFNAYVAIDPSMWYDRERFLSAVEKKLTEKNYQGIRLYVGIANTMPEGMTLAQLKKDTTSDTRHIRSIFALDKFIRTNVQNGLTYTSRYYKEDSHGSVPLASEYDGLRFIFDYYRMNLTAKDFSDSTDAFVKKLKNHYEWVSKKMGYKVSPPELLINAMGYDAMSKQQYKKAAAVFQMNIENYPNSNNVYDSYGDLLAAQKDTLRAIASYQKALTIKDYAYTRQKLNVLEGKEGFKLSARELQKYAGVFNMDSVAVTITLRVKEDALWAEVPGEGLFQLVPFSRDTFTVKNMSGYEVHFHTDGDSVLGFTSVQPNGTFKAHVKK
ncbi:alpha/beta hydrolase-fold protein [Flavisolibacter nicotianae]|uniref:alpha/beta hydrolase-fold protein n=1 Tax=Flavisolibacter nicotianae TaxID=2364882 RepID=UPI000EB5931D|nr:alpha/beta hydrolase-fold protein [Flavisolibacter nicotianae]